MTYINHITLQTGHNRRSPRAEVSDAILKLLAPWIDSALASGQPVPLPVPALSHFAATATVEDGALLVTLFAPAGPHTPGKPADARMPMVTLGVAQRSRHGAGLWPLLTAMPGTAPGIERPGEPWCAVAMHPTITAYRGDVNWMGDFERCVAWAWITRRPALESVP
ncbi:hypothetical protein DBR42_29145 [Pelomonas sp. HMWF004]|nr:hypothetical protein DBR42_29145 [Pelomonas sp. HMWF004]